MPRRKQTLSTRDLWSATKELPLAAAMRRTIARGYGREAFRADLLAGVVVGIVALPLSMALAIAVGVAPQNGLYTAAIAGTVAAIAGGSKFQVTGPTAAFVVILAPIVTRFGISGLLTAGLMAGFILVAMGVARLGRLVQFIPHPVTTGFTTGIAVVIATLQLKDVFGLRLPRVPDGFVEKLVAFWGARRTASIAELAVALVTLAALIAIPHYLTKKIPAPLIAIGSVAVVAGLAHLIFPAFHVATIGTRFQTIVDGHVVAGIPRAPPTPAWPWGAGSLGWSGIRQLFPSALAIAILGAIESLLSAVIADGMTGTKSDPNSELVGQGLGNIIAPFFGGIAATGALARTATNVRAGARSPVAAVTHAAVVFLSMILLAPLVAYIPMASLAALLLLVAWNMSERHHFAHILRVAPKSDVFCLVSCFALTVLFDMVVAVSFGVMAAALLFMRRMAELTQTRVFGESRDESTHAVPAGVLLYEIAGVLFFGAAQNAMGQLSYDDNPARVVILSLAKVPAIDSTGLVALESALAKLQRAKRFVIIAGPLPEPHSMFDKANLEVQMDHVMFADDVEQAIQIASDLLLLNPRWDEPFAGVPNPPSVPHDAPSA